MPTLLEALRNAGKPFDGRVRDGYAYSVASSLGRIAPKAPLSQAMADDAVAALSKTLDFPSDDVRVGAAGALGQFTHRASPPRCRRCALAGNENEPAEVREAASRAIEKIEH